MSYLKVGLLFALMKTCYCDKVVDSLPVPQAKYIAITDPSTINVSWDPIEVNKDNPILGVKVKFWEDERKNVTKAVKIDGTYQMITVSVPVKKSILTIPTHMPVFTAVVPSNVTTASFDAKIAEHYEIRAQTYNDKGDGPLSSASGVRIHPFGEK